LTITAGTSTQWNDNFSVQGTGTDPNATVETAPVTLNVLDVTFALPTTLAVNQGATSQQGYVSVDQFYEPITLACSGLPADATCNFSPSAVVPPWLQGIQTVYLTVSAGSTTPVGTYQLVISASAQGQSAPKTGTISLSVGNSPDYSLVATPPTGVLTSGSSITTPIVITPVGGFTGVVNLYCSAANYIACTFSPPSPLVLTGSPLTLTATISVPSNSPPPPPGGMVPVGWTSYGPNANGHYAAFNVTVMDFALAARNNSAAINAGQPGEYELTINSVGAPFTNPVSFSCSGLPAGTACSFSPATVTPDNSPAVVVLSISTPKTLASLHPPAATQAQLMLALLLPGVVLSVAGGKRSRKSLLIVFLIVVLAALLLQAACGGGGTSAGPPPPPPSPAPTPAPTPSSTTYMVTVTATSGTVQHQLILNLVVWK
jgi:hypothetical protein